MSDDLNTYTIFEHLEALRKALIKSLIGIGIGVIISLFFTEQLLKFLTIPVGGIKSLQSIEVTEAITVYMRVALMSGLLIALPWVFFQAFSFIGEGLKKTEKKSLLIAIPFATILFIGGAAFAYWVMAPASIKFFTDFLEVQTILRLKSYIAFLLNLVFWIGVSFEIPLIIFLLARLGIVNAKMLIKGWRVAIIVIAILSAVITPTGDPVNMVIFMVPLFGLYLLSVVLANLAHSYDKKNG